VTQYNGVTKSTEEESALRRIKGGDDTSWIDTNLTGQKMKKIHVADSAGTNRW
jgi:hypothetical protein